MVVTDKKTLQKVLTEILIVFIALFTPVIAAVEVLNSDFTIDADGLETLILSHMTGEQKEKLRELDSQIRKLDDKMSSAGYGARTKEAEVLWLLALYGKPTDGKTALLFTEKSCGNSRVSIFFCSQPVDFCRKA